MAVILLLMAAPVAALAGKMELTVGMVVSGAGLVVGVGFGAGDCVGAGGGVSVGFGAGGCVGAGDGTGVGADVGACVGLGTCVTTGEGDGVGVGTGAVQADAIMRARTTRIDTAGRSIVPLFI